jgi:dihydropyrimidine dehydrogenase (NAD+) subunit PreA
VEDDRRADRQRQLAYSSVDWAGQRMMGLNNIELITDRPIEVNLREIAEVKKRYPKHAVIAR